jgi:hypothetical protein
MLCSFASNISLTKIATTVRQYRVRPELYAWSCVATASFNVHFEKCHCQPSCVGETQSSHTARQYIRTQSEAMYRIHQLYTDLYQSTAPSTTTINIQLTTAHHIANSYTSQTNSSGIMCKQYIATYSCYGRCLNTTTVWDPHCTITRRDNCQGQCGHAPFAGFRQLPYPCTSCRGLGNPATSAAHIAHDGAANAWRNNWGPTDQRNDWISGRRQYERDLTMPSDLRTMTRQQWQEYYNDIFLDNNAWESLGRAYAWDREPWGDNRPGGALQ